MYLHLMLQVQLAALPTQLKHKQTTADNFLLIQAFTKLPTMTASYPTRIGLSSTPLCKLQMSHINKMQENDLPNSNTVSHTVIYLPDISQLMQTSLLAKTVA